MPESQPIASSASPSPVPDLIPSPHRKRIRHYEVPRQARMFTFSCYRRLALLLDERWRLILGDSLAAAVARHQWLLLAFVFMPEHVHAVAVPRDGASGAPGLLYAIKRPASYRIKQAMERANGTLLAGLTVRERPGKTSFRFWQEGPGHD